VYSGLVPSGSSPSKGSVLRFDESATLFVMSEVKIHLFVDPPEKESKHREILKE